MKRIDTITRLTFERETKGSVLYKSLDHNVPVMNIYVKKSAFAGVGEWPKDIVVLVREPDE